MIITALLQSLDVNTNGATAKRPGPLSVLADSECGPGIDVAYGLDSVQVVLRPPSVSGESDMDSRNSLTSFNDCNPSSICFVHLIPAGVS